MTENIRKLLELASEREELQDKLSKASKEEFISLAKEHGITLTDADLEQNGELSDDELNAVAGGRACSCSRSGIGGGSSSMGYKSCACTLAGTGLGSGNVARCYCYQGGSGEDSGGQASSGTSRWSVPSSDYELEIPSP